jgi:hypothetical protein
MQEGSIKDKILAMYQLGLDDSAIALALGIDEGFVTDVIDAYEGA